MPKERKAELLKLLKTRQATQRSKPGGTFPRNSTNYRARYRASSR